MNAEVNGRFRFIPRWKCITPTPAEKAHAEDVAEHVSFDDALTALRFAQHLFDENVEVAVVDTMKGTIHDPFELQEGAVCGRCQGPLEKRRKWCRACIKVVQRQQKRRRRKR